jgi:hypothetical protein
MPKTEIIFVSLMSIIFLTFCFLPLGGLSALSYSSNPTILILTNQKIYADIQSSLAIFEEDICAQGYDVVNVTVLDHSAPAEIKEIIKSRYAVSNLKGVILIGNISAAYSEMHTGDYSNPNALKIWIALDATDMYYMDLNGQWENITNPQIPGDIPPNVVECHVYESCNTFKNEYIVFPDYQKRWDYTKIANKEQYKAEIWISRIMTHNLRIGGSSDSGWKTESFFSGAPSLDIFSPEFNGLAVSINGVVFPGAMGTYVTRISWDWGDGNSEDHWFPASHTYSQYGEYMVRVTAFQSDGSNTTKSNTISLRLFSRLESQIINDYLKRNHDYRTGSYHVADKTYILNSDVGYNDQDMDYSQIFSTVIRHENVTRNDFLSCIEDPEGSELLYLTAHSSPQLHALYDGSVTVGDLETKNKTSLLYLLNACSACRWDQCVSSPSSPNYLGGLYVFDATSGRTNLGLCAIGFSGVGGFNTLKFFTDYLNNNHGSSYAEAYKYWFNGNLMINFGPNNYVILGDPTISPSTQSVRLEGDINGDRTVDIYDAIMLANAYNSRPSDPHWNPNADINGDNIVDIYDAIILASNYGKKT